MTWFKSDDSFWRHPKVRKLGKDRLPAVGLWQLAGTWCADNLITNAADGFVPDEQVEQWDPKHRYAKRLVAVGLWHRTEVDGETGYLFHGWEEYQPTRSQAESERERWRTNKAEWRKSKRASTKVSPEDTPEDSTGESNRESKHPRSRPRTRTPYGSKPPAGGEPPRDTAQQLVAQWIDRCPKPPPKAVIGHVGKQLKTMLAEGQDPDDLRRGLAAWMTKGLHPSTLPSVVNEVINRPATSGYQSQTDANIAAFLGGTDRPEPPALPGVAS